MLTVVLTGIGVSTTVIVSVWRLMREVGGIANKVDLIAERFNSHVEEEQQAACQWRAAVSARLDNHDTRITTVEAVAYQGVGGDRRGWTT